MFKIILFYVCPYISWSNLKERNVKFKRERERNVIIMIEISMKENVNIENNDGSQREKIIKYFDKASQTLIKKG